MGDGKNLAISGALVAVVVLLALVVKGGRSGAVALPPLPVTAKHNIGAIVIERQRIESEVGGRAVGKAPVETTLTETSRSGGLVATYSSLDSTTGAQQEVNIGNSEEIYDPHDDTIYVTTFKAIAAAEHRLFEESLPKGSQTSSATETVYAYGTSSTPGWTSEYVQDLRDHSYRVASETTLDGRAALKLIPTPTTRRNRSRDETFPTVYVSPSNYDPIRSVSTSTAQHGLPAYRFVTDWLEYKVIPATPANRRRLSLTAMHPTAEISHSAMAYARAAAPKGQT